MDEEIDALVENDTYLLTPLPEGHSVVGGRWVFAIKQGPNDEEKFKARYVAKGYSQVKDVDYQETFSPTARITSIRMLMQLSVQEGFIVHQMDVKTAYLNAPIDVELYIEQPPGYIKSDVSGNRLVCKLNKSLYGLKQSGRIWNNLLDSFLISQNFVKSVVDTCVYTKVDEECKICIILIIWVDDIIIAARNVDILNDVKTILSNRFKMKDLGQLSMFLGIEFKFENDCISMNQSKYVEKILSKFKMSNCNPKAVPCDPSVSKLRYNDSKLLTDGKLYREIVGSLIYLMSCTRPDICFSVNFLSQYMNKPNNAHLQLAKHVLKYLKGTINYDLKFCKSNEQLKLIGYCDSDWGSSEDRFSISGYGFQLKNNGPLISWKSKKQRVVALSTCEAEYMALTYCIQEAKFLRQLLFDMQGFNKESVIVNIDNQGAISLAKNPVHHQRSKHIDIRYHFIRNEIQNGIVDLKYVKSEDNVSDIFTKPVSKSKLLKFENIRGIL